MSVDVANEVLLKNEQTKRFGYERIERGGGAEHAWSIVMFGRRFLLSVHLQ